MNKRVIERNMFYGAKKNIFLRAFELRNNMTVAEKVLWEELKKKDIFKARFKSQHPIDIFVVDFYCHKYRLAIEVDGEIHQTEEVSEYDGGRSHDIEKLGIKILRFTNEEVIENFELVKQRILIEINSLSPL
ncbi:MAG: endonuclease domain-containing protein [Bacteroidia bacterium]|nr:endonuclease domain-containing protein [Bacteroidia bacterium]